MLEIGKIVNTHGVAGLLKVQPWCDNPAVFHELADVYADGVLYEIERTTEHKANILMKLKGVDGIDAAEKMKNKILSVERETLGELPDGTYYVVDLLGLNVETEEGEPLGVLDDVIQTGARDVYQVKSDRPKPLLILAIPDVVKNVDLARRVMTVRLLEGLAEL